MDDLNHKLDLSALRQLALGFAVKWPEIDPPQSKTNNEMGQPKLSIIYQGQVGGYSVWNCRPYLYLLKYIHRVVKRVGSGPGPGRTRNCLLRRGTGTGPKPDSEPGNWFWNRFR